MKDHGDVADIILDNELTRLRTSGTKDDILALEQLLMTTTNLSMEHCVLELERGGHASIIRC
jgi:hypothetical protein